MQERNVGLCNQRSNWYPHAHLTIDFCLQFAIQLRSSRQKKTLLDDDNLVTKQTNYKFPSQNISSGTQGSCWVSQQGIEGCIGYWDSQNCLSFCNKQKMSENRRRSRKGGAKMSSRLEFSGADVSASRSAALSSFWLTHFRSAIRMINCSNNQLPTRVGILRTLLKMFGVAMTAIKKSNKRQPRTFPCVSRRQLEKLSTHPSACCPCLWWLCLGVVPLWGLEILQCYLEGKTPLVRSKLASDNQINIDRAESSFWRVLFSAKTR